MHIDSILSRPASLIENRLLHDILNSQDIDSHLPKVLDIFANTPNCIFYLFKLMADIPAGPEKYHGTESVLDHSIECAKAFRGDPVGTWMALLHDCGKLLTDPSEWPHHYQHEVTGAHLAWRISHCFDLPKEYHFAAKYAAKWHMRGKMYTEMRVTTKVKFINMLAQSYLDEKRFWKLVNADSGTNIYSLAMMDTCLVSSVFTDHKCPAAISVGMYQRQLKLLKQACNERKEYSV